MTKAVAAVTDLFFVARIRETARLVGAEVTFARRPGDVGGALAAQAPDLLIVDLTAPGWDYEALFAAVEGRRPTVPVLGFTTHALARETRGLHARCSRVVTKETLTRELADVLKHGNPDGRPPADEPAPSAPQRSA